MKKFAAMLLAGVMVLSMAACGGSADEEPETTKAVETEAQDESTTSAEGESSEAAGGGKLIMVTEAGFAPYEYTEDGETVLHAGDSFHCCGGCPKSVTNTGTTVCKMLVTLLPPQA